MKNSFKPDFFCLNGSHGSRAVRSYLLLLALLWLAVSAMPAQAAITVLDYWRMGELDAGAVAGGTPVTAVDSVGSQNLKYSGTAKYSADVAPTALDHASSALSVSFTNSAYASNSIISTVQNNFGLEAWVKPVSWANNPILVYNGGTGSSGWGFMINGGQFQGLFGNVTFLGGGTPIANIWTHVALVRSNGVAMLFTNGVLAGATSTSTPNIPAGGFAIAESPTTAGGQAFNGLVDEVRFFTFSPPSAFSLTNLLLNLSPAIAVGTTNLTVGQTASSNSVTLAASVSTLWTANANNSWLHIFTGSQSGSGSTNVIFSYDTNTGATRSGTLTIAGQQVTVTQAGTNYVSTESFASPVTAGLNFPLGIAADGSGNVFFCDNRNNAVKEWTVTNNTVTTLISSGLSNPRGLALDSAGNVYISDTGNSAVKKWTAATRTVSTLFTTAPNGPGGIAVDTAGNIYVSQGSIIQKWTAASGLSTLISSGLSDPIGLAVDVSGNLYIADAVSQDVYKWNAANGTLTTLISSGLNGPDGVAVDGSGNLYIADSGNNVVKMLSALTGSITTLSFPAMNTPSAVTRDNNGNVYVADSNNNYIREEANAFVNPSAKAESAAAGKDALPVVLPVTENLQAPFFPTSDAAWLTVTGAVSGAVGFTFTTNSLPYILGRTAHISVLGQSVAVTQSAGPEEVVSSTNFLVGSSGGSSSVILTVNPATTSWTNAAIGSWLHLGAGSGSGSATIGFSWDSNTSGATRTGNLVIGTQGVTITQVGTNYLAATMFTNIVSTGLSQPGGVAVDRSGNVYIADTANGALRKWISTNNTVANLITTGLNQPAGVAVDNAGNVYFTTGDGSLEMWSATTHNVTTNVTYQSNPNFGSSPKGLALDGSGDVYVVDSVANKLEMWSPVNSNVTVLASSGLNSPFGVAADATGNNIFIADKNNSAVKHFLSTSSTLSTLVSGLSFPQGVALDGAGNVHIADTLNSAIKEWVAVSNAVFTLASSPIWLSGPDDVTVDSAGNLFVAVTGNNTIMELPHAYVSTTPVIESGSAGNDKLTTVLPATANLTGSFFPVSDSSWLTVTGATNGVVYFSFTANPLYAPARTGHIKVLGRSVTITQNQYPFLLAGTTNLIIGPAAGTNSVELEVAPSTAAWTASANNSWLHLTAANQSGTGGTNVIFTYDANTSSVTRQGTLTVGGQTVYVTQASPNYVSARVLKTLATVGYPAGLAVDASGNVIFSGSSGNTITEWVMASNTLSNLVSSGLSNPQGVALDSAGNVYIADNGNNALKKWLAASHTVVTLASSSSGLSNPEGIAVDLAGDVYSAAAGNNSIQEWLAGNSNEVSVVTSGLNTPYDVAANLTGSMLHIADANNNAIKRWNAASGSLSTLVSAGLNYPEGVAVDGSGNVYFANSDDNIISEWNAGTGVVTNLVPSAAGLSVPQSVAVDQLGNVYIADTDNGSIKELTSAFVNTNPILESIFAGSDSLPTVLPASENLLAPFVPTSDASWLTITNVANGIVTFAFTENTTQTNRIAHITVLGQSIAVTQTMTPPFAGTTNLLVGPTSGSNSVALDVTPVTSGWTASANAAWLHLSAANQSGTGCTNVIFTYDTNTGVTRSGTLTIAGQTVTVTQAGSTYVSARPLTTLVSSGLEYPNGLAVDGAGNVYISDNYPTPSVMEWNAASNTVVPLITSGLSSPGDMAADGAGNVYIADTGAVKKWVAASSTLTTVASSASTPVALSSAGDVALDAMGNIYIVDGYNNRIDKWSVANSNVTVAASGTSPLTVAVDPAADNIYFADYNNNSVDKWSAASGTATTFVPGLNYPEGVATDGSGNVYIANAASGTIVEWSAASGTANTLIPNLNTPANVKVDAAGNVYEVDSLNNNVLELPYAFVDPTSRSESSAAGSDMLPPVLPATENLNGPFAPVSDSSWLTITGATNGVVSFSFAANPALAPSRTANITVLGQTIAVTQEAAPYQLLGTTNLLVGRTSGSGSVALEVFPASGTWTASANASWLHLSTAYQSGAGCTNVVFTFDANTGATRSGTLTIAGQTVNVTQAGSAYVSAGILTPLVYSGLSSPRGVALDNAGNVYIADSSANTIKEWIAASNSVTTLVSSGLNSPSALAVDGAGNVYIADSGNSAVKEWQVASNTVTTIASSTSTPVPVGAPYALALDASGNVYIADLGNGRIEKWSAASGNVTTAVAAAPFPIGLAVDQRADNIYFTDGRDFLVDKWAAASGNVTTVVSGLFYPEDMTEDGSGNLYIANAGGGNIEEFSASSGALSTLIPGLNSPSDVKVDAAGNVYLVDSANHDVEERPYVFVNPNPLSEGAGAGNDALPAVLPTTENLTGPFTPVSDSPWLTINGTTNGVVSFSFTANPSVNGTSRTANITLLGQTIPVMQGAAIYTLSSNALTETAAAGSDSVLLTVAPSNAVWTATTNAPWLHLTPANQQGIGSATITFSFDANTGATPRTNTLTIAGQTLTVTQLTNPATPPTLTGVQINGSGNLQFSFTNSPGATFTVWFSTNLLLPYTNWTMAGAATNIGGGVFQWASPPTNAGAGFFRVSSP